MKRSDLTDREIPWLCLGMSSCRTTLGHEDLADWKRGPRRLDQDLGEWKLGPRRLDQDLGDWIPGPRVLETRT
jgi:hypothetical protein